MNFCTHCQEPLTEQRMTLTLPGCASCAPVPFVLCEACFRQLGLAEGIERAAMMERIRLALTETGGTA